MTDNKIKDHKIPVWSFVPGDIVYDKATNDAAVRVYAAISGLCGSKGYCDASNAWFAWKLNKEKTTISRAIRRLETAGHIVTMVVNELRWGNKRYIMTLNKKQLAILALGKAIRGSAETADLLAKRAIGLLAKTPIGIGKNAEGAIGDIDNHRIETIDKERESPPPRVFKKGTNGEKCLEEVCWNNYLAAKAHFGPTFDPDFYDFFEQEVMGRFDKQKVCNATLSDWYNDVWMKYSPDEIIKVVKQQRDDSNAWQIKWFQVKNRLRDNRKEQQNIQDNKTFKLSKAQRDKELAEKIAQNQQQRLHMAKTDINGFMAKYRSNPMFQRIVDEDPELSEFIPKENKAKAKRKCTVSSDGRITCTEKKKALV